MIKGVPLRVTLVVALVVLSALGLLLSGVAVTSAIEKSLVGRVDEQLESALRGWANPNAMHLPPPPNGEVRLGPRRPPSDFYVQIQDATSGLTFFIDDYGSRSRPELPPQLPGEPVTVGSVDSNMQWRVMSASTPGGTTTVALQLGETEETVDRLIALQLGIGVLVLVTLAVASHFVIRRSLRPLVQVEHTAAEIASGDLHRRVPLPSDGTEIGRLAAAINGMLHQIQQAFAQTEASEEAARRSEDKMRQFIADASHELRTPLTTIRGFSELYRQGASGDTPMLMSRIETQANRMSELVEDLMTLVRLDASRPFEQEPVDLVALTRDVVNDLSPTAPERVIELEVPASDAEVIGDAAKLRQVLVNLVRNALVHTTGDVEVVVRAADERVCVDVIDHGPGLTSQDAAQVFERFYRTDTSRTRDSGGTGLGLSIVAALVKAHGGQVSVKTAPGRGCVFTVDLPAAIYGD